TGSIWLGSRRGVARCAINDLLEVADGRRKRVTAVGFGLPDGLPGTEFLGGRQNAALCDRQGHLWLTTTRGLARSSVAATTAAASPPQVYLERILVNDRELLADPLLRPLTPSPPPLLTSFPATRPSPFTSQHLPSPPRKKPASATTSSAWMTIGPLRKPRAARSTPTCPRDATLSASLHVTKTAYGAPITPRPPCSSCTPSSGKPSGSAPPWSPPSCSS